MESWLNWPSGPSDLRNEIGGVTKRSFFDLWVLLIVWLGENDVINFTSTNTLFFFYKSGCPVQRHVRHSCCPSPTLDKQPNHKRTRIRWRLNLNQHTFFKIIFEGLGLVFKFRFLFRKNIFRDTEHMICYISLTRVTRLETTNAHTCARILNA